MKKINKILIFVILIIISSFSSLAISTYNQTGDNFYHTGIGFFNEGIETTSSVRTINEPINSMLVSDLDNDGTNEIIINDDGTIRLYQTSALTILDAYTIKGNERYSPMVIYDIDDDGYNEISIYREQAETLYILEYNGTSFHEQITHNISALSNTNEGQGVVQCRDIEDCVLYFIEDINSDAVNNKLSAIKYNTTGVGSAEQQLVTAGADRTYCFSKLRDVEVSDYDNDGIEEYIISVILGHDTSDESIWIVYSQYNSTSDKVEPELTITINTDNLVGATNLHCVNNNLGQYFTSPLVTDIDGASSNGRETVIGYMTDVDEFKMKSFKKDGTQLDDYPEIFEADGIIVSNVVLANTFTDTGRNDFCVMGYKNSTNEMDLLCASEMTGQIPETDEFIFDTTLYYNVTRTYNRDNIMITTGDHSRVTTDGNNLDEFINTYGVFRINYTGTNHLTSIYENDLGDATVLSVDVEDISRNDLLVLTDNNLWYIDDGFSKTSATIHNYEINPCIDSTWEQNTSVQVRITPTDADGDRVSARAILYADVSQNVVFEYTGVNHDLLATSPAVLDVAIRDDDFYVTDDTGNEIDQYNSAWTYQQSFASADDQPTGIFYNGSSWYLVGKQNKIVYEYNNVWGLTGQTWSVAGETAKPSDVHCCKNYCYILSDEEVAVYRYFLNWTYTGTSIDLSNSMSNPTDFYFQLTESKPFPELCGGIWWITDSTEDRIYQFDENFIATGDTINIVTQDSLMQGIFLDEENDILYTVGQTNDKSYEYVGNDISGREDSGWSSYATSDTTFAFGFEADAITPASTLQLLARDNDNPGIVDEINLTFSVGSQGVVFGECETVVNVLTEEEEAEVSALQNDSISTGLSDIKGVLGVNLSDSVFYLFILLIFGVVTLIAYIKSDSTQQTMVLILGGFIQALGVIIGVTYGFIGTGALLTIMVFAVLIIAFRWSPFMSYIRGG